MVCILILCLTDGDLMILKLSRLKIIESLSAITDRELDSMLYKQHIVPDFISVGLGV